MLYPLKIKEIYPDLQPKFNYDIQHDKFSVKTALNTATMKYKILYL